MVRAARLERGGCDAVGVGSSGRGRRRRGARGRGGGAVGGGGRQAPAWPVRLAFRVTPGSVGLVSVRADQRLVIPITPAAGKPIELELAPRMYTSKTPQMLVSWGPNSPPVP